MPSQKNLKRKQFRERRYYRECSIAHIEDDVTEFDQNTNTADTISEVTELIALRYVGKGSLTF